MKKIAALLTTVLACFSSHVMAESSTIQRETGATVTVNDLGDVKVHSYLSPQQVFANNTHIIETSSQLVLIDTQFILPMAKDYRAYADSLGKPIERLVITHEHPDHFLGSEAFADIDIYSLESVAGKIKAHGQKEIDEKKAQFGESIASTFVVPEALEPGLIEIDGVSFLFESVVNAEAEEQMVTKLPDYGVVSVGDIVYSGVHMILAGQPPSWIVALKELKAGAEDYPIVLSGHGTTTNPAVYDTNIAWLGKAGDLMSSVKNGKDFKNGMTEAFPDLGMDAAIDFVLPFIFPEDKK